MVKLLDEWNVFLYSIDARRGEKVANRIQFFDKYILAECYPKIILLVYAF